MDGMRDVLRGSLGRSLGGLTPLDRLAAAWPVACGRAMAERGEIVSIEGGVLTVRALDAVWLRQMLAMQAQLTRDLRHIAAVDLREIHFEGGDPRPERPIRPVELPEGRRRAGASRPRRSTP